MVSTSDTRGYAEPWRRKGRSHAPLASGGQEEGQGQWAHGLSHGDLAITGGGGEVTWAWTANSRGNTELTNPETSTY